MLPIIPPMADPAIRRRERELVQEADNARLVRAGAEAGNSVHATIYPAILGVVCLLLPATILAAFLLWEGMRLLILLVGASASVIP
jgi:hypothetical protein